MKRSILIITLFILPSLISAQRKNRSRYEWVGGIGPTNFLGELGGANQTGSHLLKDFEIKATRAVAFVGMRYKNSSFTAFKGGMYLGYLTGNDNLTDEPFRHNRNLSFRAPILELSGQMEIFLKKEQQGHLYKIKNAHGRKHLNFELYGFAGFGVFFFNPQANYHGSWINLQPLGTEGQGIITGKKKYSRVNISFPVGAGIKFSITRKLSLGLEYGIRKTFTDYIDDVSTTYYDNDLLRQQRGNIAADLADPSLHNPDVGAEVTADGQQRGDPKHKDAYMFTVISFNYKLIYRRKTRSKF